jgi:hypothetical protein
MTENDVIYSCFIVFCDCFGKQKEELIELSSILDANVIISHKLIEGCLLTA